MSTESLDVETSNPGNLNVRFSIRQYIWANKWEICFAIGLALLEATAAVLIDFGNDNQFSNAPTLIGIVLGVMISGTIMNYIGITSVNAIRIYAEGAVPGGRNADLPSKKIKSSLEDKVLKTLKSCLASSQKSGDQMPERKNVLVIYGGEGIGKSSLISNIFNNRQSKLDPLLEIVIWIPCGRWRDGVSHPERAEEFENVLLRKAKHAAEEAVQWKNLKKMVKFFNERNQRTFFVFDHCYHASVIRVFLEKSAFLGECMAVTDKWPFGSTLDEDQSRISFVGMEIGPIKTKEIVKIFRSDPYRLHENTLSHPERKLPQLAKKCHGSPLLAKYVAGLFSGPRNDDNTFRSIQEMPADELSVENLPQLFYEMIMKERERTRRWYSGLALLFGPNHPVRISELVKLVPGDEQQAKQTLTTSMAEKALTTVVRVRKRDDPDDKEDAVVIHGVQFFAAKMVLEKHYLGADHVKVTFQESEDLVISDYRCYILARLNKCNCPFRDRDTWLRKAVDMFHNMAEMGLGRLLSKILSRFPIGYFKTVSGVTPHHRNPQRGLQNTAIHAAVVQKDLWLVKILCESFKEGAMTKDQKGQTPLSLAIRLGNKNIVEYLASYCPEALNEEDVEGLRPLDLARNLPEKENKETFKFLAKTFPDRIRDRDGNLPLHLAVMFPQQFDPAMAELLAERNPEVLTHERLAYDSETGCYVKVRGSTPLRIAMESDQAETVRAFAEISLKFRKRLQFDNQALDPLTMTDDDKRTPLAIAAHLGYTKTVRVLLEYNRDVLSMRDKGNRTPLELAQQAGHLETAAVLSDDLNAPLANAEHLQCQHHDCS